jgi:hypothetical protein
MYDLRTSNSWHVQMVSRMLLNRKYEKSRLGMWLALCALGLTTLWLVEANAFESYHDPLQDDQGYCSLCHTGFTGGPGDTLHSLHTGGDDPVTTNCDLCHTGSGRDNPLTMWSKDDHLGCAGCHGRDYGETIGANYRGFSTLGKAKASAYGLRKHHYNAGITICMSCHASVEPFPENAPAPPNYARDDVSLGGMPLNTCTNEDTENDMDSLGLDNDGDFLYEGLDSDCTGYVVQFEHFARFAEHWLEYPCGPGNYYCGGADIDRLGDVGFEDLALFVDFWLAQRPQDWLLK